MPTREETLARHLRVKLDAALVSRDRHSPDATSPSEIEAFRRMLHDEPEPVVLANQSEVIDDLLATLADDTIPVSGPTPFVPTDAELDKAVAELEAEEASPVRDTADALWRDLAAKERREKKQATTSKAAAKVAGEKDERNAKRREVYSKTAKRGQVRSISEANFKLGIEEIEGKARVRLKLLHDAIRRNPRDRFYAQIKGDAYAITGWWVAEAALKLKQEKPSLRDIGDYYADMRSRARKPLPPMSAAQRKKKAQNGMALVRKLEMAGMPWHGLA